MIETTLIFLTLACLGVLIAGLVFLSRRLDGMNKKEFDPREAQAMTMLQNQIAQLQQDLGNRMGETHTAVRQQFAASTTVVREITERMSKVEEISRQVLLETTELQKLQQILKNPKQRGVLGEYFLETLLKNTLPPENFQMQYRFTDGEIVDAVMFVKDRVVPIDSKFSLENYNRLTTEENPTERERLEKVFVNDLKERVKETSKYIRPQEGTMDFAFMFIPHEAIYYDLLVNKIGVVGEDTENILQRAASKWRVIIVSPTSLLAYLQTVMQGLRCLQIEEQAKQIMVRVDDLKRHLKTYENNFQSVGKHLGTVVNQYNLASREYTKIDKDFLKITGTGNQFDGVLLEKPDAESQ